MVFLFGAGGGTRTIVNYSQRYKMFENKRIFSLLYYHRYYFIALKNIEVGTLVGTFFDSRQVHIRHVCPTVAQQVRHIQFCAVF